MKTNVVNYTPIPAQVPRALAVEILHSHGEIITLNPLVLEYHPIKPPRDAPNDEYYSTWYEIVERIKLVPGIGNMGSSKVSFKGVFHDMPWGIQTHMYVPLGIELRHKWQVRGNQPGEPVEPREIGSKAPASGLYLQENVEITSNPLAISFVKKELKAASKVMIDRMMKKAELVDAGIIQTMFEDGKLKTSNPMDRSSGYSAQAVKPDDRNSMYGSQPPTSDTARWQRTSSTVSLNSRASFYGAPPVPATNQYGVPNPHGPGLAIEMMGDTHFQSEAPPIPARDPNRTSITSHSELHGDTQQTSTENRRFSYISSSDGHSSNQSRPSSFYPSPSITQKRSVSELPGPYQHQTQHQHQSPPSRSPGIHPAYRNEQTQPSPLPSGKYQHNPPPPSPGYNISGSPPPNPNPQQRYNPQDYARFTGARYA